MNARTIVINFPSTTGNTTEERQVALPETGKFRFVKAYFAPSTSVTGDGTNYATITLAANDGANGSYTTLASIDTQTTRTVEYSYAMTKGSTADGVALTQGSVLRVAKTVAGTGATVDGNISVVLEKIG